MRRWRYSGADRGAFRMRASVSAILILLSTTAVAMAQPSAVPTAVTDRLNVAAIDGSGALLHALTQELTSNPGLVASPESAAALATAAAMPVGNFVGARTPVYREIARVIVAAAPRAQQAATETSIAAALAPYTELDVLLTPTPDLAAPGGLRTEPANVAALGYKVGSFTIYPDVQAATFYDDNIYATAHNHVVDWVGTVSPRIAIQSNWDRHSLYAEAQTDVTNYWSHVHENTVDWHVLADGQIDVTDRTQILLGGVAMQEHEDRASPDAVEGLEPTPYTELNAYTGVVHRFDNFTLRVGTAVERITFGNVMGLHGEINNQDRNRNRYTFGALLRYEANEHFRPFVQVMGDIRRYDTAADDFGFVRNSDGFLAGIGALFTLTPKLTGEATLGVLHRSYDDPLFKSITTPAADATIRWQATSRTLLALFTERTIEETTLYGSPGYIYTLAGLRIEQKLTDRVTGIARFAYAHSDFAQVGRNDNEVDTSIGLRYRLTRKLTLGVDYRYTQRVSGSALTDFSRNQVYFRVGVDL